MTARNSGCSRSASPFRSCATTKATPELLDQAESELQEALRELRDLARGIHPAILSEQGLGAAVRSLADRAPVAVETEVAEGRYAGARRGGGVLRRLRSAREHRQARTGPFGFDLDLAPERLPRRRSTRRRLRWRRVDSGEWPAGLADRVGALDGRLTIESALSSGTTIRAEIPCASS